MKISNHFLILILTVLSSCSQEKEPQLQDSLAFGVAYGFCVGDCAHFYNLNDGQLFKDNVERYEGTEPTFDKAPLAVDQYEIAKTLLLSIPAYLINHSNQTIGCPDCADQGGYHLYYRKENKTMFWHIDTSIDNQPEEIRDYLGQVKLVIEQLNN